MLIIGGELNVKAIPYCLKTKNEKTKLLPGVAKEASKMK